MGKLSTHVLDTVSGKPAEAMRIDFSRVIENKTTLIQTYKTNCDGRTDELLLDADSMQEGQYELLFYVRDYFENNHVTQANPAFLNQVPIHFSIADRQANYHVPLLVSPWSYSTYRGS